MDLKQLLSGVENSGEIIKQINAKLKESDTTLLFDDGKENIYIPKTRLDKEIAKRKTLEAEKGSLEKDLELTKKEITDNEKLVESLETTQKERDKLQKELEETELNNLIENEIKSFDRVPHDLADIKEKLDRELISKTDDGVKGVKQQLKEMLDTKEYLFKPVEGGTGNPDPIKKGGADDGTEKEGDFGKKLAESSSKGSTATKENNVYGLV